MTILYGNFKATQMGKVMYIRLTNSRFALFRLAKLLGSAFDSYTTRSKL